MARGTSSSPRTGANRAANSVVTQGAVRMQQKKGFRIRVLLVAAMALVIVSVTLASLWLVRNRLLVQITDDLSKDLRHSVLTFQNLQAQRLNALERENALLADLPSLKALMTTSDLRTIEDGGTACGRGGGNDLFALGDNRGRVVAAYIGESHSDAVLRANLQVLLTTPAVHYLVTEGRLYACSVQPIYFGSEKSGTLLGYVISGYAIEHTMVRAISQDTAVEVAFVGNGRTLASTLPASLSNALMAKALPRSEERSCRERV